MLLHRAITFMYTIKLKICPNIMLFFNIIDPASFAMLLTHPIKIKRMIKMNSVQASQNAMRNLQVYDSILQNKFA